jgi:Spy/CpxP family protein refolding chaperone
MRVSTMFAVACCSLLLAVAICSPAAAQGRRGGGGGGRGGFGGGVSETQLLQLPQVQKELELVDDQIAKIMELAGDRSGFAGLRDLSNEERREKMATAAKERKAKLDAILLPAQQARLAEITLQMRGTSALNDEDIQTKLGITADQKTALSTLRDENRKAMGELFAGGGGGRDASDADRAANREKFAKAQAEANEKVLAVLTSDQKAEFEKMQGKKIEIDRAALRGQGGPGGPGGGGRRGRGERPAAE